MDFDIPRTIALLRKIIDETQTNPELVEFYDYVHNTSLYYLARFQLSGYHIADSGESLSDIAHYCAAGLFSRNEQGFHRWQDHVNSLGFPTVETAKRFFLSIIYKKTRQVLSKIFHERDRVSWNAIRMIKHGSKIHGYAITKGFIIHSEDKDKPLSKSDLDLTQLYSRDGSIGNEVRMMLDALPRNGHARAIKLNAAKEMIKTNMLPGKRIEFVSEERDDKDDDRLKELTPIVEDQIIDPFIKDVVYKAIDEFCQDPGNNKPWHQYDYWPYAPVIKLYWDALLENRYESMSNCFRLHFPDQSYKSFRKNHRDRTDYLLKIVRLRIKEYLES